MDGTHIITKPGELFDLDAMTVLHHFTREEQKTYFRYPVRAPGHVTINLNEAPKESWLRCRGNTIKRGGAPYLCRTSIIKRCKTGTTKYIQALGTSVPNTEYSRDEKSAAMAVRYTEKNAPSDKNFIELQTKKAETESEDGHIKGIQESVDKKALHHLFRDDDPSMELPKESEEEPFTETWPGISPKEASIPKIDSVFALSCEGWPVHAKHWPKRKRKWPSKDIINEIINGGYHLVPKASPGGNQHVEWRVSFSSAENYIMGKISNVQFTVFSICKGILKNSITVTEILSTYHFKTMFFWSLEKKPLEFWKTRYLKECVFGVLELLLHSIGYNNLPHYFMSGVNLWSNIPSEFLSTAGSQIIHILQNLTIEHIPREITESGCESSALQFAVISLAYWKRQSDLLKAYMECESNKVPDHARDIKFLFSSEAANIAENICFIALLASHAKKQGILTSNELSLIEKLLNLGHFACNYILDNRIICDSVNAKFNTDADRIVQAILYIASATHALMNIIDTYINIVNYVERLIKSKFEKSSWRIIEQELQTLISKLDINMDEFIKDKTASQLANEHFWNTKTSWKPKELQMTKSEDHDEEKDDWEHHLEEAKTTIFDNGKPLMLLNVIECREHKSIYMLGESLELMSIVHLLFPDKFSLMIPVSSGAK